MTGIWLISYIALWILFLILAVVLLLTVRSLSVVVEKLQALQPGPEPLATTVKTGETLPDVELRGRDDALRSLHSFRGTDTAVVVVSPGCGPCRDVLAEVGQHPASSDPLHLHVSQTLLICLGEPIEAEQELVQARVPASVPVFFDPHNQVKSLWGIQGTPTMIIVNPDLQVVHASAGFTPSHM